MDFRMMAGASKLYTAGDSNLQPDSFHCTFRIIRLYPIKIIAVLRHTFRIMIPTYGFAPSKSSWRIAVNVHRSKDIVTASLLRDPEMRNFDILAIQKP